MTTCRCRICGRKHAGQNRNKRLYSAHDVGQDEFGRWWDVTTKREARRLLRRRMSANLPRVLAEFD